VTFNLEQNMAGRQTGFEIVDEDLNTVLEAHGLPQTGNELLETFSDSDFQTATAGCKGDVEEMTAAAWHGIEKVLIGRGLVTGEPKFNGEVE
jgi:hypothetical protein